MISPVSSRSRSGFTAKSMRKKGSQKPTKDAGATAIAVLRREAIRGALGISAISLACNIGALAVPLYNMEVFNRVMTTHNMRTLQASRPGLPSACCSTWPSTTCASRR